MSGHRHPFYTKYRVGFNKDGLIKALDTDIYNNAGYSLDLSFSVMHRAMFHVDNAYNIPKVCFYALSFYVTKTVLVGPKWFSSGQVDLDLTIMIWSQP